jgi:hypothetical protein
MAHDELLREKIQHYNWVESTDLIKALDSIVELHKNENGWCLICNYPYPCETIQAIEKELK